MQWNDTINGGFSTGKPWLSVNGNYPLFNVEQQLRDQGSVLQYYQALIAYRNQSPILQAGSFAPLYRQNGVYAYARTFEGETLRVVINLTAEAKPSPFEGKAIFSSYNKAEVDGTLAPYEAAILRG